MRKQFFIAPVVILIFLSIYWFKTWIGINLLGGLTLHELAPFKYLQGYRIKRPGPGEIIIHETFDRKDWLKRVWRPVWMREKGKVHLEYDPEGLNGSQCLLVRSESERDWACFSVCYLRVKQGDVFEYSGRAHLESRNGWAVMSFTTYNENRDPIDWNYGKTKVIQTGSVVSVLKRVSVQKEIAFIRFHISGVGKGEFRFDDIRLKMISEENEPAE